MKFKQVLKEANIHKKSIYKIYLEFAYDRENKDFIVAAEMPQSWDIEKNKIFKTVRDFTLYLYHATNQMNSGSSKTIKIDTEKIRSELQTYMNKYPNKFVSLAYPGMKSTRDSEGKWDALMQVGFEIRDGSNSFGILNLKLVNPKGIRRESSKKILPQDVGEKELLDVNLWKTIKNGTINWSNQSPINQPSITGNVPKQKKRGPEIYNPLSITA